MQNTDELENFLGGQWIISSMGKRKHSGDVMEENIQVEILRMMEMICWTSIIRVNYFYHLRANNRRIKGLV